ncbi:hypothetical protein [Meridianimarinicoccus aquatilis]|uniref:hypothetical protein n=1 Tax=Meridianimarinicoccus aquatilis TaxID=2552766 RepID=UPI0013E0D363|nr:hypothetical protein [Fluviibacterium aquatile]QIE40602.1 hypothetical protein G5B39_00600 [Rhodobacteraceae bacterium SC52]
MSILWFLVLSALTIVPLFKLLPQYGINPWFALTALFLPGLIVLLWIMAARVEE